MLQVVHDISSLENALSKVRKEQKTIGLVPTMGALHQGHASLIKAAAQENDVCVVSVFVNPTQFGPNEDFGRYPRTLDADCKLAQECGATIVFSPDVNVMYPSQDSSFVTVEGKVTEVLCGKSRPIHFRGVTTVVAKLFNIVRPTKAYFGQKDAQQVEVIKRMVKDFFFPLELRIMPIVREESGLALSSRNTYLSAEEKQAAMCLFKSLNEVNAAFARGERNVTTLERIASDLISSEPLAKIDYVKIYGLPELFEIEGEISSKALLALAVYFGNTRLIDNIVLE